MRSENNIVARTADIDKREFDDYSTAYNNLLKDPIRDRFMGAGSDFFHVRKRDLIREYFHRRKVDTQQLRYLDLGCGKGELMTLLRDDFDNVTGCDPSAGMMEPIEGIETRWQEHPFKIPFDAEQFDFVTAVCVYHHVPTSARGLLTAEVARVLKPGGIFAMIEHNPYNPVTRLIVSRTPVDRDAVLLKPAETKRLMIQAGMLLESSCYFLLLPSSLYRHIGALEKLIEKVPLGGQHATFGTRRRFTH
jgi:SAM-dependent methyltransferase